MKLVHAPSLSRTPGISVFLAGTIDQGQSRDWQSELSSELEELPLTVFNPRRPNWDATWNNQGDKVHRELKRQIRWELTHLEKADLIALWLEGGSSSPVSLLEMGIHAHQGKLIVGCPPNYYRYANVYTTAQFYGIPLCKNWASFKRAIRNKATQLCGKAAA